LKFLGIIVLVEIGVEV